MYDQKTLRSLLASMGVITTSFGLLANLIDVLDSDEAIECAHRCKIDKKKWLMVCTDRRVLLLNEKLFNAEVRDINFSKISSVSTEGLRKIFKGGIKIQYSGGSLECDMSGVYAAKMCDCIAGHLRAKDSTVNVVVSPTPNTHPENDPYEEIKKLKELLDLGLITSEEFDCKKKQLLGL